MVAGVRQVGLSLSEMDDLHSSLVFTAGVGNSSPGAQFNGSSPHSLNLTINWSEMNQVFLNREITKTCSKSWPPLVYWERCEKQSTSSFFIKPLEHQHVLQISLEGDTLMFDWFSFFFDSLGFGST